MVSTDCRPKLIGMFKTYHHEPASHSPGTRNQQTTEGSQIEYEIVPEGAQTPIQRPREHFPAYGAEDEFSDGDDGGEEGCGLEGVEEGLEGGACGVS